MKLKKILKSILSENNISTMTWYHGSNQKIKKFDYAKVGKNDSHITNYHGWGIYFISNLTRAKKYGEIVTEIQISNNSNILQDKVTPNQCKQLYDGLVKNGIEVGEREDRFWLNPTYGEYSALTDVEEFYGVIQRFYFTNKKQTSDFLASCGIDGMLVINDMNDEILVVFNDNIVSVKGYL